MRAPTSMPAISCIPKGPTGRPKAMIAASISGTEAPFFEQEAGLAHVVGEHSIGHESEAVPDDDGNLAQAFAELH